MGANGMPLRTSEPATEKNRRLAADEASTTGRNICKRLIDLVGSCGLLLAFSPILGLIALAVRLGDGGPVIYRRRVLNGKGEFNAYKFRTMRVDADAALQADRALWEEFSRNFKLKSDPRVTPVGYLLRRTSLDELPQLFNVLKGEMSLVGPRMVTRGELEKYGPYRELLLTVKPGLTGYWQIHGRQQVSYEERVSMDLYYIQNRSLLMDLGILLQTPWKVIKGDGAY